MMRRAVIAPSKLHIGDIENSNVTSWPRVSRLSRACSTPPQHMPVS